MKATIEWLKEKVREEVVRQQIIQRSKLSPEDLRKIMTEEIQDYLEELENALNNANDALQSAAAEVEKEAEETEGEKRTAADISRRSTERDIASDTPGPEDLSEQDTSLRQGHQAKKTEVYEAEAVLIVKDTVVIDNIYSEIRAIEGVTVVSTDVKKVSVGASREKSIIKIKFMKGRRSLQYYITLLIRTIMRVNGVVNVKMAPTKKIEL